MDDIIKYVFWIYYKNDACKLLIVLIILYTVLEKNQFWF